MAATSGGLLRALPRQLPRRVCCVDLGPDGQVSTHEVGRCRWGGGGGFTPKIRTMCICTHVHASRPDLTRVGARHRSVDGVANRSAHTPGRASSPCGRAVAHHSHNCAIMSQLNHARNVSNHTSGVVPGAHPSPPPSPSGQSGPACNADTRYCMLARPYHRPSRRRHAPPLAFTVVS